MRDQEHFSYNIDYYFILIRLPHTILHINSVCTCICVRARALVRRLLKRTERCNVVAMLTMQPIFYMYVMLCFLCLCCCIPYRARRCEPARRGVCEWQTPT